MDPLAILAGFGVGVIVGMTGVGGGSLMTPLLMGVFKMSPGLAIGTDLWFAALTKSGGSWVHWRLGHVDTRITVLMLCGSVPATLAMVALMHLTGITKGVDQGWAQLLTITLGVALLLTALCVAFRRKWQALGLRLEGAFTHRQRDACTVASGALLGVMVSLSSIGAGAIGATILLLLYPRLPAHQVVGTDIAHAVPLTLIAGIGYATLGLVDWALLGALLVGSLPGIWLGSHLTRTMPEGLVRGLLCASLLGAGLKVLT